MSSILLNNRSDVVELKCSKLNIEISGERKMPFNGKYTHDITVSMTINSDRCIKSSSSMMHVLDEVWKKYIDSNDSMIIGNRGVCNGFVINPIYNIATSDIPKAVQAANNFTENLSKDVNDVLNNYLYIFE